MFIQTEATPNPATLKFLPGKVVMENGTAEFRDEEEAAAGSALAARLFMIPGVTGVYFGYDFITVTKEAQEWQHLKPAILGSIMEHFMSGQPVMAVHTRAEESDQDGEFFEEGGRDDRCDHQGIAGNPRSSGCGPGWRRYHLQGFPRWHGLPQHEGRLRRLPVLDGDAEAWRAEPAASFHP